jgi:hypothetical protein
LSNRPPQQFPSTSSAEPMDHADIPCSSRQEWLKGSKGILSVSADSSPFQTPQGNTFVVVSYSYNVHVYFPLVLKRKRGRPKTKPPDMRLLTPREMMEKARFHYGK